MLETLDAPPALELWLALADAALVLVVPTAVAPVAVVAAAVWLPSVVVPPVVLVSPPVVAV